MFVSQRQAATVLGVVTFAGVMVLPWHLLLALVVCTYLAAWFPFRRAGARAHRHAYTAASVAAASLGSSVVMDHLPTFAAVPVAIAVYIAINAALVMVAITVAGHREAWQMFRSRSFYTVLVSTLSLGAAVGLAMQWHLPAGLAGLPVLAGIHLRAREVAVADSGACRDDVWERGTWLTIADEVARSGICYSVMLFDLERVEDMAVTRLLARERFSAATLGQYSDRQLVVLVSNQVVSAANARAVRFGLALAQEGVVAGVGAADSLHGPLADVLLLAESQAFICRYVVEPDDDLAGLV